jgi:hypothetical protein
MKVNGKRGRGSLGLTRRNRCPRFHASEGTSSALPFAKAYQVLVLAFDNETPQGYLVGSILQNLEDDTLLAKLLMENAVVFVQRHGTNYLSKAW